jgi:hypothetical protein
MTFAATKKNALLRSFLAEKMGFEPMCPSRDNRISSAARYGHFATSPVRVGFVGIIAESSGQVN